MPLRDFALLVFICVIWAANFIVTKLALAELNAPPLLFSTLRFALVLLATLPWLLPMPRPRWRILVVGLLMGGGGFGLVSVGMLWATPSSAAVVTQLGVPMTALLSVIVLGERIGIRARPRHRADLLGHIAPSDVVPSGPASPSRSGLIFVAASALASAIGIVLMKQMPGIAPLQFQAWVGLPRRCRWG
ncbi:MAG: EamA family transporter [Piscinibacter sp.]